MSTVTITGEEIYKVFKQLAEVNEVVTEMCPEDRVGYFRSFGANMGVAEDDLDAWIAGYVMGNAHNMEDALRTGDFEQLLSCAASWMYRSFYVGLALGRDHPVK